MENLTRSFDFFFKSDSNVAVLKGDWGVGKTYFWSSYAKKQIEERFFTQSAYSYVSLFGKTSFDDVKRAIFHNAKPIKSEPEISNSFADQLARDSTMLTKAPWLKSGINKAQSKARWLSWLTKNSQNIPLASQFSGLITDLEYLLVDNYIVCLDDIERKGRSLSIKEVMGLIDELALRKRCKVILIFNESSLESEEDKTEFDSYREKVVDLELSYLPSCGNSATIAFPPSYAHFDVVLRTAIELNITNIRVLKKMRRIIDDFSVAFADHQFEISEEFIQHAMLLSWGYFVRDEELSFELIQSGLSGKTWLSLLVDEKKERSIGEQRYDSIASNLALRQSQFDTHIVHYLKHGFFDRDELASTISEVIALLDSNRLKQRIDNAWEIYRASFADNISELIGAFQDILVQEVSNLNLSEFSSIIRVLEDFGVEVSSYISSYIDLNKERLKGIDIRDTWSMERIKNPELQSALVRIHDESRSFSIDGISEKIANQHGWNPEDLAFLGSLRKQDFYHWMKGNPDNLNGKLRDGLLIFRSISTSDEKERERYRFIANAVVDALKDIAKENALNSMRVKFLYQIE